MIKAIDINERTLEEEKKKFTLVCKVFEAMCIVMLIVITLIAAVVTGVIISIGAGINDILVFAANSTILLFGMVSALNFGRAIFRSFKSGETPFRYDVASKVRDASLSLLICSFLSIIMLGFSCNFSEAFSDICHNYFFIAIGNCFVGGLLGIISYVMNFGCKLQQESDETL